MSATVVSDLKNGCQVTKDGDGYQVTRVMYVHGLTATAASGKIIEAVNAAVSGLTIGTSTYPDDGTGSALTGCVLRSATCRAVSGTSATVELLYSNRIITNSITAKYIEEQPFQTDVGSISFSAGLTQVQTIYDKDDSTVDLSFPAFLGIGVDGADALGYDVSSPKKQSAQFAKDVPQKDITITVRKTTTRAAIDSQINTYINKVNSATWMGGDAGTWKFMGCDARSDALQAVWDLTWYFSWREDGWTEEAYYIREDGKVPDADERGEYSSFTSTATITKYTTANFSSMTLLGTYS